jgi:ATP synthase protein I
VTPQGRNPDDARQLWRISALGTELALGIVAMLLIGLGIDHLFGTEPWGVIVCTVLGVLASGYNFLRQAYALAKRAGQPYERDPR